MALIGVAVFVWLSYFGLYHLSWQRAVKLTLIIIIFEGVLRKWVLPQASELIYFLKDLLLLVAYLKYYLSSEPKYPFKLSIFNILLILAFSWSLCQTFNPSLGSPIIGFFGLKAYFFYMPLMWLVPSLFKSEEEIYRFLRNYLLLLIPVSLLAIAQFFSPVSSPINVYAGGEEANATLADGITRVTATFPYLTGFSTYLTACFSILIPMLTLPQTKIWRWLTFAEAFLVVATSFMTGARTLLLYEILFVVGYSCILFFAKPKEAARSAKKFILPITLIATVLPRFFTKAIDAFFQRAEGASKVESVNDRALIPLTEPVALIQQMQLKALDGYGIGATHQAVPTLRLALNLPVGDTLLAPEVETSRVTIELGVLGLLLWYLLRLVLILSTWRVLWRLESPWLRQLILSAFLFQVLNLIAVHLIFNTTFAIYYWFFCGFILLFPELEYRQSLCYRYRGQ
ncbi:hypothetical protein IJ00_24060 [Calothrix sp. 336/3]|nr:hypothetical protein IJ00_24060 [Calothrix sp. 336/3]